MKWVNVEISLEGKEKKRKKKGGREGKVTIHCILWSIYHWDE